jgi:hypothetical protein
MIGSLTKKATIVMLNWFAIYQPHYHCSVNTSFVYTMSLPTSVFVAIAVSVPAAIVLASIVFWKVRKRSQKDKISIASKEQNTGKWTVIDAYRCLTIRAGSSSLPSYKHHHIRFYLKNPVAWLEARGFEGTDWKVEVRDEETREMYNLYFDGELMSQQDERLSYEICSGGAIALVRRNMGSANVEALLTGFILKPWIVDNLQARSILKRTGLPVKIIPQDPPSYRRKATLIHRPGSL